MSAKEPRLDHNVADVVIVGAGLSGLSAAHTLIELSPETSYVILEASNRVGGRNHSDADGIDLGAGYIGPLQDRIMRMVDLVGLKLYKVYTKGKTIQYLGGKSTPYDGIIPPISALGLLDLNAALVEVDRLATLVGPTDAHKARDAAYLDSVSCAEWIRRQCWTTDAANTLVTTIRTLCCVEPCQMSILSFAWYVASSGGVRRIVETEGGAQDSKVAGGTGQISQRLAGRLAATCIRLNHAVRSIQADAHHVTLTCSNGTQFVGRAAILAMPPAQQARCDYTPPLHPNRMSALQQWPMGHIIKSFTFYDRPFWREKGLNGTFVADFGITVVAMDDSKPDGTRACLMGFVVSDQAAIWAAKTPGERREALAQHYAKVFGTDEALRPCGYKEKVWAEEPYVGGCYTGIPTPGALVKYPGEIERERIHDRVFIAGTEAAKMFSGYMDGAVESGERSARNVLVSLGRLPKDQYEVVSKPAASSQMPFVPMEISKTERYFIPSVPTAVALVIAFLAIAVGVAVGWAVGRR